MTPPPDLPVVEGGLEHDFRRFMQPAVLAMREVAPDRGNRMAAAQVNVGSFPAHVVSKAFLIAFFGKGLYLNVAAIGSEAADDPVLGEMNVWIEDTHGAFHKLAAQYL